MKAIDHNNRNLRIYHRDCCLADDISRNLNQGGLYEIYQIIDKLNGREENKNIDQVFIEKYHFDFRKYS